MKFNFKYVSNVCPELTETEVNIVLDHLYSDSRYEALNRHGVRREATKLFPFVLGNARHLDGRDKIESAIKALTFASAELNRIPKMSDDIGRTNLDIKMAIHYLSEELANLKGDNKDAK